MKLICKQFKDGDFFPLENTGYGDNKPVDLSISDLPQGTKSLMLIFHDPDAPIPGGFLHYLAYNIKPNELSFTSGKAITNGTGGSSYFGPQPPAGHGVHNYNIIVYALPFEDLEVELNNAGMSLTASFAMFYSAMNKLGEVKIIGKYEKR